MKKISLTCLMMLTLLTGCSSAGTEVAQGMPQTAQGMTAPAVEETASEKPATPIDRAFGAEMEATINATVKAIETERATTGTLPVTVPLTGNENIGETVNLIPNLDQTEYCLHVSNVESKESKTYYSDKATIENGGTCDGYM